MKKIIFILLRQKTPSFLKLGINGVSRTLRSLGEVGFLASKNSSTKPWLLSHGAFIFFLFNTVLIQTESWYASYERTLVDEFACKMLLRAKLIKKLADERKHVS